MAVQPHPRPPLEVAEAKFPFELPVPLFAHPARLDGSGQGPQRGPGRQVAEAVLASTAGAPFAYQPDRLAQRLAVVGSNSAVADPDTGGGEPCPERARGAVPPAQVHTVITFDAGNSITVQGHSILSAGDFIFA